MKEEMYFQEERIAYDPDVSMFPEPKKGYEQLIIPLDDLNFKDTPPLSVYMKGKIKGDCCNAHYTSGKVYPHEIEYQYRYYNVKSV